MDEVTSGGPGDRRAQIELPAQRRSVGVARNFVVDLATEEGWMTPSMIEDLRLAVSEAITNAIEAQTAAPADAQVTLRCLMADDRFEVRVVDRAGGFDVPEGSVPLPEPDPNRTHGFGLPLMGVLVDDASFGDVEGGTEVRLVLWRRPPGT